jgi:tetratricopeptide (TPR) repeat protein
MNLIRDHGRFPSPLRAAACLACLWLCACAAAPDYRPEIPPLENQPVAETETVDILAMTPEMKQFVDDYVRNRDRSRNAAWSLSWAALDPYILDFDYDPRITLPADQAFAEGRGNCLTFSNLFIAMAREAGMDAWYREVSVLPEWSSVNDTMLVSMHVNAAVRSGGQEFVIDVSRREETPNDRVRRLTDSEAAAQFYNNLGVDALVQGDLPLAYAHFLQALEARGGLAYVWSNLGVVYRRNDQTEAAKLAYRTALQYDPQHSVSLNNLYVIFEEEGQMEEAEALLARVERLRRRNPYYLLHLADIANHEERSDEAVSLLKRALRMNDSEFKFHLAMARSRHLLGEEDAALASLATARKLAPDHLPAEALTLEYPPGYLPEDVEAGETAVEES